MKALLVIATLSLVLTHSSAEAAKKKKRPKSAATKPALREKVAPAEKPAVAAKPEPKPTFNSNSPGEKRFFNLSLVPDVAVYKRTEVIEGFSLSIWGENEQRSFALGLVNGSRNNSAGLSFGVVNYSDNYTGAQLGAFNWSKGNHVGFQGAFVNFCQGAFTGVQFGIVNYTDTMESGLQLGLVNIIAETKTWFSEFPKRVAPGMILANWRFK